jgi:group I intron endonuclease
VNASGVYMIRSPSGRFYIGSSSRMSRRWSGHCSRLRRGLHESPALQNAWNKYGSALVFKPLLVCRPEDRIFYEGILIEGLRPALNARKAAGGGAVFGRKVSAATRVKLAAQKGWKHTDESRAKMRRKFTPEHRAKLSAARAGKPGPWFGKTRSAETAAKISETLKARETLPFWLHRKNLQS